MPATANDFLQLTENTLAAYMDKPDFEPILEYQNFVFMDELIRGNMIKFDGGTQIEKRAVLGTDGSARMVDDLLAVASINVVENVKKVTSPWVSAEGQISWNKTIANRSSGKHALIDYMKERVYTGYAAWLKLCEDQAAGLPDDANDTLNARSWRYWISPLDSGTVDYDGGFLGQTTVFGDDTTTTNIGGIDAATEPLWRNYAVNKRGITAATYDSIVKALTLTGHQPPRDLKGKATFKAAKRLGFMSLTNLAAAKNMSSKGPDNLNGDLRKFNTDNSVVIHGVEMLGVASMEDIDIDPIIIPDLSCFKFFAHEKMWMERSPVYNPHNQHKWYIAYIDGDFNFICLNRRRQIILHEEN